MNKLVFIISFKYYGRNSRIKIVSCKREEMISNYIERELNFLHAILIVTYTFLFLKQLQLFLWLKFPSISNQSLRKTCSIILEYLQACVCIYMQEYKARLLL